MKPFRIIALCVFVACQTCFGQGDYAVRTQSLVDSDVETAFAIGDITFVVRNSELTGNSATEGDLSKLLAASDAAKKGLPDRATANLIDQVLGGHHEPHLTSASAIKRGNKGFVWKISWELFPNPGGFSGIPFEYQAYVRPNGSVVRPQLFLCDHLQRGWLSSDEDPLLSHLALTDLVPANSSDVDTDQIRRSAEDALADAKDESKLDFKLRFVGLRRQSYPSVFCGRGNSPDECLVWAVNFVPESWPKADQERLEPFTIWVTSDYITSRLSSGRWQASKQRK